MISVPMLRELYDYNYWARDKQLEACAALTPEQFTKPLGSSFPSVRDTLAHLLGAEWIWLERWRGNSPRALPGTEEATGAEVWKRWAEQFPSVATLNERWQTVEQDVRKYLAGLKEEVLERPLTYANLKGETWTYPLGRTLFHVVNHQTYHRGQVTTLLRQLGVKPVAVDFLVAHDLGILKGSA